MKRIIAGLGNLVLLRNQIKALWGRYSRIIVNMVKLIFNTLKLIIISVNYLSALIILPAIIFFLAYLVTKEFLIPSIISIVAIIVYLVIMSNYFSKGVHKFGEHAKAIKQAYHTVSVEHRLALESLKSDKTSDLLLGLLILLIIIEILLIWTISIRFNVSENIIATVILLISLETLLIILEYTFSGHKLFRMEKAKRILDKRKGKNDKADEEMIPAGFVKSDSFDELIIEAGTDEEQVKKKKGAEEE